MKSFVLASLALAVVACSASDPTQSGDEGLVQCAKSACGPQLGMPNYLCPDGVTWAGPTGQCISTKADPQCHWQVVSCPTPPPDCTKEECGVEPLVASQICSDGGTAGPVCERVNGVCGWHITTCNDCTKEECGPEPMIACQADAGQTTCERTNGVCGWHVCGL